MTRFVACNSFGKGSHQLLPLKCKTLLEELLRILTYLHQTFSVTLCHTEQLVPLNNVKCLPSESLQCLKYLFVAQFLQGAFDSLLSFLVYFYLSLKVHSSLVSFGD